VGRERRERRACFTQITNKHGDTQVFACEEGSRERDDQHATGV
jgi:hypothetical protein